MRRRGRRGRGFLQGSRTGIIAADAGVPGVTAARRGRRRRRLLLLLLRRWVRGARAGAWCRRRPAVGEGIDGVGLGGAVGGGEGCPGGSGSGGGEERWRRREEPVAVLRRRRRRRGVGVQGHFGDFRVEGRRMLVTSGRDVRVCSRVAGCWFSRNDSAL